MEPLELSDSDERIDEEEDVQLTDEDEERSDEGFDEEEDLTNEAKTFEDEERDED